MGFETTPAYPQVHIGVLATRRVSLAESGSNVVSLFKNKHILELSSLMQARPFRTLFFTVTQFCWNAIHAVLTRQLTSLGR